MLGNFTYCNPTALHFGPGAMDALAGELAHYGPRVQLIYGGGSIKKNGIYDQVGGRAEGRRQGDLRGPRRHAQPHGGKALRGLQDRPGE